MRYAVTLSPSLDMGLFTDNTVKKRHFLSTRSENRAIDTESTNVIASASAITLCCISPYYI